MIERTIRSLRDMTLNTSIESYALSLDEVTVVKFKGEDEFNRLLALCVFVSAINDPVQKPIPVIPPPIPSSDIVDMTQGFSSDSLDMVNYDKEASSR